MGKRSGAEGFEAFYRELTAAGYRQVERRNFQGIRVSRWQRDTERHRQALLTPRGEMIHPWGDDGRSSAGFVEIGESTPALDAPAVLP
jgi:hypothetical protein